MLSESFKVTPMAGLARPIAGTTAEGCLIVTLPGSIKGATENLAAIQPLLPHALRLAAGESSRKLHSADPSTSTSRSNVAVAAAASPSTTPSSDHVHSHKTHDHTKGREYNCA